MDYKDMKFLEAAKIRKRMTNSCSISCRECPLGSLNNSIDMNCSYLEFDFPEEYLRILYEWDKAFPVKTILQDFREKYPNAPLNKDGTPKTCATNIGYCDKCIDDCVACWNQPAEEQKDV